MRIEMIAAINIEVETMIWIILAFSFIQLIISSISFFRSSKKSKEE